MRPTTSLGLLLSIVLTAACGDDSGGNPDARTLTPDGAVDATPIPDATPADARPLDPATCPTVYGPASIVNTLVVADNETTAFDLDGDGTGDNILASVASVINMSTSTNLMDGSFRAITEIRLSDDPTLTNDTMVQVTIMAAKDGDMPVDTADDFSGSEGFYFDQASVFPEDCAPRAVLDGPLVNGVFDEMRPTIEIPLASFGNVNFGRPHIEAHVAPDVSGVGFTENAPSRLGGAIPTCPLAKADSGIAGMSDLWALAQLFMLQPDIDLDGDGLETIQTVSAGINSCTDGDGTVITGDLCGCDPRIADGYSVLFTFTGVGAAILGPNPTP